jgi:flagellar motor switch protein FliN/FliY
VYGLRPTLWSAEVNDMTDAGKPGIAARGAAADGSQSSDFEQVSFERASGDHFQGDLPEPGMERILNIPVTLSMEIGRTRLSIGHLLRMSPGAIVKLDRPVGEPLDILVNGCLVARGEVVVVNEKFGIRITDVVSREDRVKTLK